MPGCYGTYQFFMKIIKLILKAAASQIKGEKILFVYVLVKL